MELRPSINPVLAGDEGRVFGPGPAELLERTHQTGSLRAAAAQMGMAYSKATRIIRTAEEELGYALLERRIGGASGGGSALTFEAKLLLARYRSWQAAAQSAAQTLFLEKFSRLACAVMASGEGARFGSNKLLAPFAGSTVLDHVLDALDPALLDVAVVTRSQEVAALAEKRGLRAVLHDGPLKSDSLRAGLDAHPEAPACMFVQGDQPLLAAASVRAIVLECARRPDAVVRLAHGGTPGSPVVFPRACFDALRKLDGDVGGSELLRANPALAASTILVEAGRACELADIDTPDDLAQLERLAP